VYCYLQDKKYGSGIKQKMRAKLTDKKSLNDFTDFNPRGGKFVRREKKGGGPGSPGGRGSSPGGRGSSPGRSSGGRGFGGRSSGGGRSPGGGGGAGAKGKSKPNRPGKDARTARRSGGK
jgi:hypothetical protein